MQFNFEIVWLFYNLTGRKGKESFKKLSIISVFQWYVVLLGMFVNETFHIRCFARNVC